MKLHNYYNILLACLLCFFAVCIAAEPATISPKHEERYHALLNELRCLVCQNQTIAESDADLAKDLRAEVKKMLEAGATDRDIIDFMANRYGDFVLYKPLVKPKTYLLWFGPFIILVCVLGFLILMIKKQKVQPHTQLTSEEQAKFESALNQDSNSDD